MSFILFSCSNDQSGKGKISDSQSFSIPDSLSLQESCSLLSFRICRALYVADTGGIALFNRAIDSAAQTIGTIKLTDKVRLKDSILAMVYRDWHITFDPRDSIVETLLPHLVYKNKKGACLGVSLIILMLAEKLDCPIYGVMLPGHFFCRFDDGKTRINIEPNLNGYAREDEYYRKKYPAEGMPWYDLSSLSHRETAGMLCYNAGTICMQRKLTTAAISLFDECNRFNPALREAQANRALAFALVNNLDSAMAGFERLFRAVPAMKNLAMNYGALALAVKDCHKASQVFQEGIKYYPDEPRLQTGILGAQRCLEATR